MINIDNITERYTPEMGLFVLVCRAAAQKASAIDVVAFLSKDKIDWGVFYQIIATHQVRPIVYRVLSEIAACVDATFFNKLKQDTLRIASGNLMRLDEMLKVHGALSEAGIASIPYKGVLLSQFLYGDFVTRETADIDIMVRARDFSAAYGTLVGCGYKPAYFFSLKLAGSFVKTESELLFTKSIDSRLFKVEMHWEVTHKLMRVPVSVEQLFNNAKKQVLLGRNIQVLDVRDLVIILMTHHGVNDVWRTFRHVADIAAVVGKDEQLLNSVEMRDQLSHSCLQKTSAIGMQLCYDLFGVGNTSSIQTTHEYQAILNDLLDFASLDRNKLSTGNIRRQFMLRDSFTDKLRLALGYVKVAVTPNIRDVETLRLPNSLYFLYYFLKPFLLLARRK